MRPIHLASLFMVLALSALLVTGCPGNSTPEAPPSTPPAPTFTPTMTGTLPPTDTPTFTRTFTMSPTPTSTFTPSMTPSETPTFTETHTRTPTSTFTATLTRTPTATFTLTFTVTSTPVCGSPLIFGRTIIGSNPTNSYNVLMATAFSMPPAGGTVHKLVIHCDGPGAQAAMGIYSHNGTYVPDTLLVQSGTQSYGNGWTEFPIPPTVLAAGNYWIAILVGNNFAPGWGSVTDEYTLSSSDHSAFLSMTFGAGTLPASSGSWVQQSNVLYDMYAVYCP